MSHYDTLQVHPKAEPAVITAAYKALAKMHHPDRKDTVGMVFKAVNDAYEVLSDPDKRRAYDAARENIKGKVIGEFRIESPIAEGGFGKTYLGRHILVDEPVCIKHCSRISATDTAILVEEAKAMWDLRHFSIPAVRNMFRLDDGSLALVLSYVPGPTLAQVVEQYAAKGKRLDPEDVAWMTERIMNALSYIHRHGVVHGDLKPQNVIVQPEKHSLVLVDFGLAAIKPSKTSGSKGYTELISPPEQVKGSPLLPQTDFYSVGMTMIYALVGGDPVRLQKQEVPHDVPKAMREFILRLIQKDVLSRPDWKTENLFETVEKMRVDAFGRARSGMKPLDVKGA